MYRAITDDSLAPTNVQAEVDKHINLAASSCYVFIHWNCRATKMKSNTRKTTSRTFIGDSLAASNVRAEETQEIFQPS